MSKWKKNIMYFLSVGLQPVGRIGASELYSPVGANDSQPWTRWLPGNVDVRESFFFTPDLGDGLLSTQMCACVQWLVVRLPNDSFLFQDVRDSASSTNVPRYGIWAFVSFWFLFTFTSLLAYYLNYLVLRLTIWFIQFQSIFDRFRLGCRFGRTTLSMFSSTLLVAERISFGSGCDLCKFNQF